MLERRAGLIVELLPSDSVLEHRPLFSDLGRVAQIRLAAAVAKEVEAFRVTALALSPGYLPGELTREPFGQIGRASHAEYADLLASETPARVALAVVALAMDPAVSRKSGGLYSTWALAQEYGLACDEPGDSPLEDHVSEALMATQHRARGVSGSRVRSGRPQVARVFKNKLRPEEPWPS